MSLFDKPDTRNLAEVFPPGTPFRLISGWIEGQARTSTGAVRTLAKVLVSPVENPEHEIEYGVWGSLCEQVRGIQPGELPAIVTLNNDSGLWLFAPHGKAPEQVEQPNGDVIEQPRTAVPEAHLDLENGETDAPTPVPPAATPVGTGIDDSHAAAPPELPPAAAPRGTELDESQAFQPGGPPAGE